MKYIIFLLWLSLSVSAIAQTGSVAGRTGDQALLTEQELQLAKSLFLEMMQTETYKLKVHKMMLFTKKSNRVMIFPDPADRVSMNEDEHRVYVHKKLEENITKTDFESLNEATALWDEVMVLTKKNIEENEELFAMIAKASPGQLKEIKKPQQKVRRDEYLRADN